jgi:hypothetical protein
MDKNRLRQCRQRAWELWWAAVETRLRAEELYARSRQLRTESRQQRLARCMAGANPLTVAITAMMLTQRQLW